MSQVNFNKKNYDKNYIENVLSLREPQRKSLDILSEIIEKVDLSKKTNLIEKEKQVKQIISNYEASERNFLSLTFALATGVGKTRLMGAIISYLYTQKNMKNFFVVAPNTTIYNKLKQDLGNPSSEKYVFKGLGCFDEFPQLITDDDYKNTQMKFFESELKIYVYNIDKFNNEKSKMREENEFIGDSFINYLKKLNDLILIMDESHHFRAEKGSQALEDLEPILGIELTATPEIIKNNKSQRFKNIVYNYPLGESIKDGYTRTPYAMTRKDMNFNNFGDWETDKLMIDDGISCHEYSKNQLSTFAFNNNLNVIKPFTMIVCKDTNHAKKVYNYIVSKNFKNGDYQNKCLLIHSNLSKSKKEAMTKTLLEVEKYDNPIEIVIHVDMLKEGWDVNNLYTIIPLRTAASKILREQMVGRGLRLPYGKRVNEKAVDSVMLTAHDKFDEILEEAKKGDSIFQKNNFLDIESLENTKHKKQEVNKDFSSENLNKHNINNKSIDSENKFNMDDSLLKGNSTNLSFLGAGTYDDSVEETNNYIPIPQIKSINKGKVSYQKPKFKINFSNLNFKPVNNFLYGQNLVNQQESINITNEEIVNLEIDIKQLLIEKLRDLPEIDYENDKNLILNLIKQLENFYSNKYSEKNIENIVYIYQNEIVEELYKQILSNMIIDTSNLEKKEFVYDVLEKHNVSGFSYKYEKNIYEDYEKKDLKNIIFNNFKKNIFDIAKFDSEPEVKMARILETDSLVDKWIRPHKKDLNLIYNSGKLYQPDFIVETNEAFYILEIKGEHLLDDQDIHAKNNRAISYCKVVNNWSKNNNRKKWIFLFIPSKVIKTNFSFRYLIENYNVSC
ncbi:DEAD/DEAH box helicase family protein [Staphylococcus equorum]|uniref:DEAD/DEAH box helicase n=1 Tax=Staphylococcus equorum TaxID=246432 RepID=UPI003EBFE384